MAGKRGAGSAPKNFPWLLLSAVGPGSIDGQEQHRCARSAAQRQPRCAPTPRGKASSSGAHGAGQHPQPPKAPRCRRVPGMLAWPRVQPGLKAAGYALLGGEGCAPLPYPPGKRPAPGRNAYNVWKRGRKGTGKGVYTFENCQPCRVMGDPNRITRQTCILPSILKRDIP